MDRLLEKLWNFVAQDASLTLQVRLFRLFCLTTGILSLVVIMPANVWQNLPVTVNVANVILGLIGLVCYRESRRGRDHLLLFFVVMVVMLDSVWYLNGGSEGSITYYFFPLVLYPMTLFRGRTRWILVSGLMLNACGLLVVEYFLPTLTTPFKAASDRVLDLASGILCGFIAMALILWVIIMNYDWERTLISRYAKELGVSEAHYRGVVENARSIILRVDPLGRVRFFNRFAEELFGYSRQEIIGRHLVGTIVPTTSKKGEDLAAITENLLKHPDQQSQIESENLCRDGRRLRIIWSYQPLYDDHRQLQEVLCVGADVTERAALLEQLQLTQQTVDSAAEQIIWTDDDARILYANAAAAQVLGHTQGELRTLSLPDISAGLSATDWIQLRATLQRDRSFTFEGRQRRKDGTEIPVEVTATYMRIGDRSYTIAFIRDITARKEAEAEKKRINEQLVDISRHAGMAEVAISVLHNVGNVLNSANVSAGIISDSIRKSRLASLSRLADLINQHSSNLGKFFAEDSRGQQVPAYLQALAQHLGEDQSRLLKETESLTRNIEHIKEIVATQQSSARVLGLLETLSLSSLVEDALLITAQSFARHDIELVRDFQVTPPVTVDKHKVMQIVVNLLRNAQQACDETRLPARQIIVRVIAPGADRVAIEVEDNGIGIAPENMTRIFNYGFTTRKLGHGFGLHSCALTARDLGGSLTAHSDGPGMGARFNLELPVHAPNRSTHR